MGVEGASIERLAQGAVDGRALDDFLREASKGDRRMVLGAATRVITTLLGERGSCILLDGAPRVVLALHRPAMKELEIDLDRYPEVRAAARTGDLVTIHDAQGAPELASVRQHLPPHLRSVVAVPLTTNEGCLGVVLVQSTEARHVDAEARRTAAMVARIAALLLRSGEVAPPPARHDVGAAPTSAVAADGRILVVEDDGSMAGALVATLSDEGYHVDHAEDGARCLTLASATRPDLIVLDVNLPGMSGLEAATRLRQSLETRHIPILFLSGTEGLPARVRDAQLELVDFMPKPFGLDELLARIQQALEHGRARQDLLLAAEQDELTGLGNLRAFRRSAAAERARFARYGHPLSIAMFDVDKLKAINDVRGHAAGSEALRAVARVLRREARDTDVVARYGGDEFVVLLPDTVLVDARVFCKRVCLEVAALPAQFGGVTVSVGVASITRRASHESEDALLRRADRAAYRAKGAGGNRVCIADDEPA